MARHPDDAAAHLTLGKFECFVLGNWDEGLGHLAQGADATLKAAAALELQAPGEASPLQIGDAWWDAAEADAPDRDALRAHAARWYRREGKLTGLKKTRVEKRLAELAAETTPPSVGQAAPNRPQVGRWFDVLAITDPTRSQREKNWLLVKDGLKSIRGEYFALPLPIEIDGNYDLRVEFATATPAEGLSLAFPVAGKRAALTLGSELAGLDPFDGKWIGDAGNKSRVQIGTLGAGKMHRLDLSVRRAIRSRARLAQSSTATKLSAGKAISAICASSTISGRS